MGNHLLMDFPYSLKILDWSCMSRPAATATAMNLLAVRAAHSTSSTYDRCLHRGVGLNMWAGGGET